MSIEKLILNNVTYDITEELKNDVNGLVSKERIAIPANTVISFPGDGIYRYNPLAVAKVGDQKVWFYDANDEPITVTANETAQNEADGSFRFYFGGNGTITLIITGTSLVVKNYGNNTTLDKYWAAEGTDSYYTLDSVPVKMKFNQNFIFNVINFDEEITQTEKYHIDEPTLLDSITEYTDQHSALSEMFRIAPTRLQLYEPYPIRDGGYFPNPMDASTTPIRVVFWDEDMNIIAPPSAIFSVYSKYCTIQKRHSIEIKGDKVRVLEWYAHGDTPSWPYPTGSMDKTEWYTFSTPPKYISMNGTYNMVVETEYTDDTKKYLQLTDKCWGLADEIAEHTFDAVINQSTNARMFNRWLKSSMIYSFNKQRHAFRLATFNIATSIRYHWPALKECLEEYGIDICGLQEVRYPLLEKDGYPTLIDYFTGWAFPYVSDNGDAYQHGTADEGKNERNILSRIPIDSTEEYELTMGTDYRFVAKSVLSLPQYMNKRGSENLKLSVYNFQLEVSGTRAQQNADEVLEVVANDDNPFIILMGDTNDFSIDKKVWQKFQAAGFTPVVSTNTATVSGTYDYQCLDNFFVSSRITALDYDVIWSQLYPWKNPTQWMTQLSDHNLVIADVVFDYSDIRCVNYHLTNVTATATNNRTWLSDTETLTITLTPASGYTLGTITVKDCMLDNPEAITISGNTITLDGSKLIGDVLITCSGVAT